MEFTFAVAFLGALILVLGSIAIGVFFQLLGDAHIGYEWVITAIGALIGAFVASEFIVAFQTWEPVYEGLALLPALVGGVIGGGLTAAATRYVTRETIAA